MNEHFTQEYPIGNETGNDFKKRVYRRGNEVFIMVMK